MKDSSLNMKLIVVALPASVWAVAAFGYGPWLERIPIGGVWAEYCKKFGVASDESWLADVRKYEKEVLSKR